MKRNRAISDQQRAILTLAAEDAEGRVQAAQCYPKRIAGSPAPSSGQRAAVSKSLARLCDRGFLDRGSDRNYLITDAGRSHLATPSEVTSDGPSLSDLLAAKEASFHTPKKGPIEDLARITRHVEGLKGAQRALSMMSALVEQERMREAKRFLDNGMAILSREESELEAWAAGLREGKSEGPSVTAR